MLNPIISFYEYFQFHSFKDKVDTADIIQLQSGYMQ